MIGRCGWCRQLQVVVAVGCIEAGSGPGALIYACWACMRGRSIVPLTEHPDDTDGHPRFRVGQFEPLCAAEAVQPIPEPGGDGR